MCQWYSLACSYAVSMSVFWDKMNYLLFPQVWEWGNVKLLWGDFYLGCSCKNSCRKISTHLASTQLMQIHGWWDYWDPWWRYFPVWPISQWAWALVFSSVCLWEYKLGILIWFVHGCLMLIKRSFQMREGFQYTIVTMCIRTTWLDVQKYLFHIFMGSLWI
jgi:hypothetical protein